MTDSISTPLNDDSVVWMMDPTPITIRKVTARQLSEAEFETEFSPYKKDSGDLYDFSDVARLDPELVWTIVESGDDEDDNWYAAPGFHVINKMGYVVSDTPWTEDIVLAVYFDASGFEKDGELDIIGDRRSSEGWFTPETLAKADAFTGWVTDLLTSVSPEASKEISDFALDLGEAINRIDAMPATDAEHDAFDSAAIDFARAAIMIMISQSERGA